MTAIIETSTFDSEVTQLETTDLVLGGVGGPSNRALVQLANRTKWLYDRIASLTEQPFAALPFPTIDTATNKITLTALTSAAGGRVQVAAGIRLTLSEVVVANATGRLRSFTTVFYQTLSLLVSSTYYLRAQVDANGSLLLYVQRGTDSDATPASKVGTPDAASGGGFDSTAVDMLIAKVVTGIAGSLPTVTPLANSASLFAQTELTGTVVQTSAAWQAEYAGTFALNWARQPRIMQATGSMRSPFVAPGAYVEGGANILYARTVSRYTIGATIATDWNMSTGSVINYTLDLSAMA